MKVPTHSKITSQLIGYFYVAVVTTFVPYFYRTIHEPDYFWHVTVGKHILNGIPMGEGMLRTWADVDDEWLSTQPLAEITMYLVDSLGGLTLVAILRFVFWLFLILWLYKSLLTNIPRTWNKRKKFLLLLVACSIALLSASLVQERPQTISLLFVLLLSERLFKLGFGNRTKPDFVLTISICLWSLFHPTWIVFYLIVIFIVILRWSELFKSWKSKSVFWLISIIALPLVPLFGPSGNRYYYHIYEISLRGKQYISEWQFIWNVPGLSISIVAFAVIILCICFYLHLFEIDRLNKKQLVFLSGMNLVIVALFISAARNLVIAYILSVAIIRVQIGNNADADSNLEIEGSSEKDFWEYKSSPIVLRFTSIIIITFVCFSSLFQTTRTLDDLKSTMPLEIFEYLASSGSNEYLFNSPNDAGFARFFIGDSVIPITDGRIDRYEPSAQAQYNKFLSEGHMSKVVSDYVRNRASAFLLRSDSPAVETVEGWGWKVHIQQRGYLLLRRS